MESSHDVPMFVIALLQSVAILGMLILLTYRERVHRLVTADLLDRVMARSYGEYVASTKLTPERPLRRRVLSDEELAALEQRALAEARG